MKKILLFLFAAVCCNTLMTAAGKFGREMIACGDNKVVVLRPTATESGKFDVVWRWCATEMEGRVPASIVKAMGTTDDCKPVDKNRKLLITSSSGAVVLLDRKSRRVLFYAHTPMAHSAEWLPGGKIAVALSTHRKGNSIELYDMNRSDQRLYRDSLFAGHGVAWVKSRRTLYALGFNHLRAYQLVNIETDHPTLRPVGQWEIPGGHGHDLSIIDKHNLLVTNTKNVFRFNIDKGTFSPFPLMNGLRSVKSANYDAKSGQIIFTKAEKSWWTHHIYSMQPAWTLSVDSINLYKVRVVR